MLQLTKVAIGLGGNQGDRLDFLKRAAERLAEEFLQEAKASSVYETEPWGVTDQPKFLNAVVVGLSEWKPPAIVNFLKTLERDLGRKQTERYGPREIDLDLLVYGSVEWSTEGVVVPHERLAERDFVLMPLAEVWPDWRHPRLGKNSAELLSSLGSAAAPQRIAGCLI